MDDQTNPVKRLQLVTNTQAAADVLYARARSILGPEADIRIRIEN